MKNESIRYLKGVGPRRERLFNAAGVYTLRDLLYYFPFRYEDRTQLKNIKDLVIGETALVKGTVRSTHLKKLPYYIRKSKIRDVFELILEDSSGSVSCVWFNQGYLADTIVKGDKLIVYGKLYLSKRGPQITAAQFEKESSGDALGVGRIIGIYRLPSEFSQRFMRALIRSALDETRKTYFDPLPYHIRKHKSIPNIVESLEGIHFPSSWEAAERARQRFIFEELFFSQILVYIRKARHRLQGGIPCLANARLLQAIRSNFSYPLTASQEKALGEILADLAKPYPMHRLLQGDVGCGKTLIAAFAIGVCADCGLQAALMVPTEALAQQHYQTLTRLFRGLGFTMSLISSSTPKKELVDIRAGLQQGTCRVVIGTHALIQESIRFKKLGLAVIDEQHKFGVAQRSLLPRKGEVMPHCLVMSATPIPRSLALSLYGDLDLSIIAQLPPNRLVPETIWVKEDRRQWVYDFLEKKLQEGRQVYIVYPVIDESEDEDLKSLNTMHKVLVKRFCGYGVAMFHGKMNSHKKQEIIADFRDKKIGVLLCTTVVEVGLDIENATVMVVENPERFGLSQLHQLRGRIQRSQFPSSFILISRDNIAASALNRLEIISRESCGFKIAEEDLRLRGPGDFFGDMQHGLPDLKIADPLRDLALLQEARRFAYHTIKSDPNLNAPANRPIREYLNMRFKGCLDSIMQEAST